MLEAQGITADEAVLALITAKGLGDLRTREVAARLLRRLADTHGLSGIATALSQGAAGYHKKEGYGTFHDQL